MNNDFWKDERLGERLREEMNETLFSEKMKKAVIVRARETSKRSFWARELTIPMPVVALALAALVAVPLFGWRQAASLETKPLAAERQPEDRLIVSGAGVFYESQLSKGEER